MRPPVQCSALLLPPAMDRAPVRPVAAAVAALHLLAITLVGAASARPLLGRLPVPASRATTTSALAVAPAAAHAHQQRDDAAAATEGKWLPFAGAHHLPPAYWAHKPVPWAGFGAAAGASPELGLGGAGGVVEAGDAAGEEEEDDEAVRGRGRERRRRRQRSSSYAGDGRAASTRQEQLAMWASLLNPEGRGGSATATATGWLPAPGIGEAADGEPGKAASDAPVEGAEVDAEPSSAGQSYWGNNGN